MKRNDFVSISLNSSENIIILLIKNILPLKKKSEADLEIFPITSSTKKPFISHYIPYHIKQLS